MAETQANSSERRTFLGIMLGGVGVVIAAAAAWPIWRFLSPRTGAGKLEEVKIPRAKIPLGGAYFFNYRGRPAVALQENPGKFSALSAVCTHLGCIVKWVPEKDEFLCPCHGGRYSAAGKVLGGPPPKPLETLPVSLVDDEIQVG